MVGVWLWLDSTAGWIFKWVHTIHVLLLGDYYTDKLIETVYIWLCGDPTMQLCPWFELAGWSAERYDISTRSISACSSHLGVRFEAIIQGSARRFASSWLEASRPQSRLPFLCGLPVNPRTPNIDQRSKEENKSKIERAVWNGSSDRHYWIHIL